MKQTILILLLPAAVILMPSCTTATGLTYQPTMSPEQMADSEDHIRQVDDQDYVRRDRERRSVSRATEESTRHNPTHVTENRTSVWFW